MSGNNHGQTVAAWTLSITVMIAFLVGAIGVVLDDRPFFWTGVALIGVGLVAGKVLSAMGYGKKS